MNTTKTVTPIKRRVLIVRGLRYMGKILRPGSVIQCDTEGFRLLTEGRRAVEFDENNPKHVEAAAKGPNPPEEPPPAAAPPARARR